MEELENEELDYEELIDNIIHKHIEYLNTPEGMKSEVIRVFSALPDDQKAQVLQIVQKLIEKE